LWPLLIIHDIEGLDIVEMGNPKHNDVFLVTGPVGYRDYQALHNPYRQTPARSAVIAVRTWGCTGCVFQPPNIVCGIEKAIHVDVYVQGCAAKLETITDGLVLASGKTHWGLTNGNRQ